MANEKLNVINYPDAKQKYTFITIGPGEKIHDPYQWMENAQSALTKKYISNQNEFTKQVFNEFKAGSSKRGEFLEILKEFFQCKRFGVPMPVGGIYFQFVNSGNAFKDILIKKKRYDDANGDVVIDNNKSTDVLTVFKFSPDNKYLAYAVILKDTYTEKIRIISISNNTHLDDEVNASYTSITWHIDSSGFFYSNFVGEKHGIFYHRLGESKDTLCVLIETNLSEHHRFKTDMAHDGKYLFIYQTSIYYGNLFYFIRQHRRCIMFYTEVVQVAYKWGRYYKYVHNDENRVIFLTNRRASNRKLVLADFHYKRAKCHCNWIEIVPKLPNYIIEDAIAVAKDKILIHYRPTFMIDEVENKKIASDYFVVHRIYGGCPALYTIRVPLEGGYITQVAGSVRSTEVFFIVENFRNAGMICRFEFDEFETTPKPSIIYKNDCFKNRERPKMLRRIYKSFDSKRIIVTLIFSKAQLGKPCRCLLTVYEGFNSVLRPYFDPYMLAFIESMQGVFAIAHIRGSGEFGDKWHRSGMKTKKTHVIKDLLYVTNGLIREGITTRKRLAIRGVHHGGFVVAASANISPGFCRVAIIKNGILDLLAVTNHKAFLQEIMTEFGISFDSVLGRKFLYRISPSHNITFPICDDDYYPATLVVVTSDAHKYIQQFHSLKYIANLQDELSVYDKEKIPMLLKVESTSNKLESMVDELVFMEEFLEKN